MSRAAARWALLLAVVSCSTSSPDPVRIRPVRGGTQPTGLLQPGQVLEILDRSPIQYQVVDDAPVEARWLVDVLGVPTPDPRPVDPFLFLEEDESGVPRLTSRPPPPAIRDPFEGASLAFARRDYDEARRLYRHAAELAPDYFKSFTYLGRAEQLLDRPQAARRALERALELNPLDYQAHLFMADVLAHLDLLEEAKAAITRAFVLNRTNPAVGERLQRLLPRLDLRLRTGRLAPRLRIDDTDGDGVTVSVNPDPSFKWVPLGLCLACWSYEATCAQRSSPQSDPLRLTMYRECLLHHTVTTALRVDAGNADRDDRVLLDAIERGYLDAVLFWEVLAVRVPAIVFLLPETTRREIGEYIERYVYDAANAI
jgi:hypothetical protein